MLNSKASVSLILFLKVLKISPPSLDVKAYLFNLDSLNSDSRDILHSDCYE